MDEETIPFTTVLTEVMGAETTPIHLLYRLSDLSAGELAQFKEAWAFAPDAKRRIIARHLADISEENFVVDFSPLCKFFLNDSVAEVRKAGLDGLWDTSDPSLISPVIKLLEADGDNEVRALAGATLGHYVLMGEWGQVTAQNEKRIIEALLAQFDDVNTPEVVQRAVLESLGGAEHERVPAIIRETYYGGDEQMQVSAVFAMGRTADPVWMPIIIEELDNYWQEMRLEAIRAAGALGLSDPVDRLIELLEEGELEEQMAIVMSLGMIGSDQATAYLQRVAEDPAFAELNEAIEEALEEVMWLSGGVDFSLLDLDEADDDWDH